QENLREPEQKTARYFHNELKTDEIPYLSTYDVIIIAPNDHHQDLSEADQQLRVIEALAEKVNEQLFVKLPKRESSKQEELRTLQNKGFTVTCLLKSADRSGDYELLLVERASRVRDRFMIPVGTKALFSRSKIVEVELAHCCDRYGFSYSDEGYHPYVETIKQYIKNPNITYDDSSLKRFYETFQPHNLAEALSFKEPIGASPIAKGWIGYPWFWRENMRVTVTDHPGE